MLKLHPGGQCRAQRLEAWLDEEAVTTTATPTQAADAGTKTFLGAAEDVGDEVFFGQRVFCERRVW